MKSIPAIFIVLFMVMNCQPASGPSCNIVDWTCNPPVMSILYPICVKSFQGGSVQKQNLLTGNYCLPRISGNTSTPFGIPTTSGSLDQYGNSATFNQPAGITTDGFSLYTAEFGNSIIRKISLTTGYVETFAGLALTTGSTDGVGSAARFTNSQGITTDGVSLYIADNGNHMIRMIDLYGANVVKIGGTGAASVLDGNLGTSQFSNPYGITYLGGFLYVTDNTGHTLRRIDISLIANYTVTTMAGLAASPGSADGNGSAARFSAPRGLTADGTFVYIADYTNHTIRRLNPVTLDVITLAGLAGSAGTADGIGTAARFNNPDHLACDGTNLYVSEETSDTIRKINLSTRVVTTMLGTAGLTGTTDGYGSAVRFTDPSGLTYDGNSLYISDKTNHTIRMVR